MEVRILVLISLFECLQVLQLIYETLKLTFQSIHFALALSNMLLFLLRLILLLIKLTIKILCAIKSLRNLKLKSTNLS